DRRQGTDRDGLHRVVPTRGVALVGRGGGPGPRDRYHAATLRRHSLRCHPGQPWRQGQDRAAGRRAGALHSAVARRVRPGRDHGDDAGGRRDGGGGHRLRRLGDPAPPRSRPARSVGVIDAATAEHAETAVHTLIEQARTVATAESLTGGLICAALTMVPGSSATVRGGVVVYATELKSLLTGIAADVVRRHGPVSAEVAAAMAGGVRNRLTADLG